MEVAMENNNIRETISFILSNYNELKKKGFAGNELISLFKKEIPLIFSNELELKNNQLVKGGCGIGAFAKVPWICIMDKDITDSVREGYGLAILFSEDMSRVYLTVNQGFTWFLKRFGEKNGCQKANLLSEYLNEKTGAPYGREINLGSERKLSKGYEATTIYSKSYEKENIDKADFVKDIKIFLKILEEVKNIIGSDYESFNKNFLSIDEEEEQLLFSLKRKGKTAILIYENNKFILQKGSYISEPSPVFKKHNPHYYEMALKYYDYLDENRILTKNLEFDSPSAAAAFANGRATNGRTGWIDQNGMKIYKYMQKNKNSDSSYWLYTPGVSGQKWDEYYSKGIMAIEDDGLKNLDHLDSKTEIKNSLIESMSSTEQSSLKNKVLEKWEFSKVLKIGDVVFAKKGQSSILGKGIVASGYLYDAENDISYRLVDWVAKGKWDHISQFDHQLVRKSLTNITKYNGYGEEIDELIESDVKQYNKSDFLEEIFISEEKYDNIVSTLLRKKNIILQGSPGVGKTFCAKKIIQSIIGRKEENRIFTLQFHQSYSYEDFIQGYRPNGDGKFELKNGLFYEVVKKACEELEANPDNPEKFCIIIDEINRGNLSKIFGELMMLIESDKRNEKWAINLTYSDEEFYIPKNLYIIGTMNTADRSLTMVDYALRRRFAFIDLEPAFSTDKMRNYLINVDKLDYKFVDEIMHKYSDLNVYVEEKLGKGFRIGHSYFINQFNDGDNIYSTYNEILEYEVKPLLEEYFFDDETRIEEAISKVDFKDQ